MTIVKTEEQAEKRKEWIKSIWENPNWEMESSEYCGDGYFDIIMTVEHEGDDFWTSATSKDGEIIGFGDNPLYKTGNLKPIAEYMGD